MKFKHHWRLNRRFHDRTVFGGYKYAPRQADYIKVDNSALYHNISLRNVQQQIERGKHPFIVFSYIEEKNIGKCCEPVSYRSHKLLSVQCLHQKAISVSAMDSKDSNDLPTSNFYTNCLYNKTSHRRHRQHHCSSTFLTPTDRRK